MVWCLMRSRSLALLPSLLVVVLLAACSKPEPAPEPVRAVRTRVVDGQTAVGTLEYAAEVKARTESRLSFRVGGKLLARPVELGQSVRRGQLLGQLDVTDLGLGAEAAQAALRAAQVNLDQATADLKRFEELKAQGFISAADLERRASTQKAAQATFEQARAQAGVQGNQAQYSRLVADVAGVVTAVEAEPGAVLSSGTPVLKLAHDGPRDVVFQVPEDRIAVVRALLGKAGALQVELWGSSAGSAPLAATVREVSAAADPVGRTFQVKADLGRAEVRLGQTATVRLQGAPRQDVQRLPLAAVSEAGGRSVVWLLDAATMTVRQQPIEVAGAEGTQVLVAQGLAAGQEVVVAGVHVLTPGQKVTRYVEPVRGNGPAVAPAASPAVVPVASAASR
ncbi:efflux transporter, RND family, MFP subunit [Leptothrix cholodnii SP-6]|uniref:Efflux transporter, RND family, MFP subunit n=2 Tax=Leptothrix cholodnii TaxID=34029 RepID=B1Y6H6_LEPCP|nr:efflux transporter, RND family, MFP subunit [Leptothrix cholodnii SP-6]